MKRTYTSSEENRRTGLHDRNRDISNFKRGARRVGEQPRLFALSDENIATNGVPTSICLHLLRLGIVSK